MKRLNSSKHKVLVVLVAVAAVDAVSMAAVAQEEAFYYRKGERVPLTVDASKSFVLFRPQTERSTVENAAKATKSTLLKFEATKLPATLNLTQDAPQEMPKWAIIENSDLAAEPLSQSVIAENVLYKAPFFRTRDKEQVGMSHLVYVKLNQPTDKAVLEEMAAGLKVTVVGNNKQLPLWFTLACNKDSGGNALQVANKLYESKNFAVAEPDFLADFQIKNANGNATCANDAHFGKQWGVKNTGQNGGTAGIDIGVCDA